MIKFNFFKTLEYIYLLSFTAFVYLPLIILILFSFNSSESSHTLSGFSTRWYQEFIQSPEMLKVFFDSIFIACASTFLSLALSLTYVIGAKWFKLKTNFFDYCFFLNAFVPEIFIAICILSLFVLFKIPMGMISIICGHTLLGLGVCIPTLKVNFEKIDPLLTEASQDLGANYNQTFWYILFPMMRTTIIGSSFVTFTLSLDDFFIALFASGSSSVQTIATYVYTKIRAFADPSLNALSAIVFAISFILVLILAFSKSINQALESNE